MNHISNISKIGLSLGALAWSSSALAPTTGILVEIVKAFAPELGATFVAKYDPALLFNYFNKSYPELNHDVKKLMLDCVPRAVELVTVKYLKENPYKDKFVTQTLNRLIKDSKNKEYNFTEQERMLDNRDIWLEELHNYIFLGYEDEDGKLTEIEAYFKENLPQCYDIVFIDGLKDEKDERPFKSLLIKSLEGILQQTADIPQLNNKILYEIQSLRENIPSSSLQISKQLLINKFDNIDKKIIQLLDISKKTENDIDKILQNLKLLKIVNIKLDFIQEKQIEVLEKIESKLNYYLPNYDLFARHRELNQEIYNLSNDLKLTAEKKRQFEINAEKADLSLRYFLNEQAQELGIKHLSLSSLFNEKREELNKFEDNVTRLAATLYNKDSLDSPQLKLARKLFEEGDAEGANKILSPDYLKREKAIVENGEQYFQQKRTILSQEYLTKAYLIFIEKLDKNWFDEAYYYYNEAIGVQENFNTCYSIAFFLLEQKDNKKSIVFFNKALKYVVDEDQKASVLNNLGNLYRAVLDYKPAINAYIESLQIWANLSDSSIDNSHKFAHALNNLAILHRDTGEFKIARSEFEKALEIFNNLIENHSYNCKDDVAMVLNNLATLYWVQTLFTPAKENIEQSLKIYRDLIKSDFQKYSPFFSASLNTLAILLKADGDLVGAEKLLIEALEIKRKLVDVNSQAYSHDMASTLLNLANTHWEQDDLINSEKEINEALKIYRILIIDNPDSYQFELSGTLNNFGVFKNKELDFDKALLFLNESLIIRRNLALINEYNLSYVAETLINIAVANTDSNNFDAAEESYKEALEIYKKLIAKYSDIFLPRAAVVLYNLGNFYSKTSDYDSAEIRYFEALAIYQDFAKKNSLVYGLSVARTMIGIAILYYKYKPNKEASMQNALLAFANAFTYAEQVPEGARFCQQAIAIWKAWGEDLLKYVRELNIK